MYVWLLTESLLPPLSQRYEYYVQQGVSPDDIAPMPAETIENIYHHLSPRLLQNPAWQPLREDLVEEVHQNYQLSLQKAIVDYILRDANELKRLKIVSVPRVFPQKIIRAPVPWHDSLREAFDSQTEQLFITNRIMSELQLLWENKLVVDVALFTYVHEIPQQSPNLKESYPVPAQALPTYKICKKAEPLRWLALRECHDCW